MLNIQKLKFPVLPQCHLWMSFSFLTVAEEKRHCFKPNKFGHTRLLVWLHNEGVWGLTTPASQTLLLRPGNNESRSQAKFCHTYRHLLSKRALASSPDISCHQISELLGAQKFSHWPAWWHHWGRTLHPLLSASGNQSISLAGLRATWEQVLKWTATDFVTFLYHFCAKRFYNILDSLHISSLCPCLTIMLIQNPLISSIKVNFWYSLLLMGKTIMRWGQVLQVCRELLRSGGQNHLNK